VFTPTITPVATETPVPTVTVEPTISLSNIRLGLPDTTKEFNKFNSLEQIMQVAELLDAIAPKPGFFPPDAAKAYLFQDARGSILDLECDGGSSPCMIDMATAALDVKVSITPETPLGIQTQDFIYSAFNVPVTLDTPSGVVIWVCYIGDESSIAMWFDANDRLKIAHMSGMPRREIHFGRSDPKASISFDPIFDNEVFKANMKKMSENGVIVKFAHPVIALPRVPEKR
jgi:hypothetical protein